MPGIMIVARGEERGGNKISSCIFRGLLYIYGKGEAKMNKFYTLHLVSFDGGRLGQTWKQWHCYEYEFALRLMKIEQAKPDYASMPWEERRYLRFPKSYDVIPIDHIGGIHTNISHGNYMIMYISQERLLDEASLDE